jgi:hypothetical protein
LVNWRENIEFFYVLGMLISNIVIFFTLYDNYGLMVSSLAVAAIILIEAEIAYSAFETEKAIARWEKIGRVENKTEVKSEVK